jgi:carboxyl-terminal processing protease
MSKKTLALLIGVVAFFSVTTLAISETDKKKASDIYSQVELFSYALTTVQSEYVDEKEPKDLIYGALEGYAFVLGSAQPVFKAGRVR